MRLNNWSGFTDSMDMSLVSSGDGEGQRTFTVCVELQRVGHNLLTEHNMEILISMLSF